MRVCVYALCVCVCVCVLLRLLQMFFQCVPGHRHALTHTQGSSSYLVCHHFHISQMDGWMITTVVSIKSKQSLSVALAHICFHGCVCYQREISVLACGRGWGRAQGVARWGALRVGGATGEGCGNTANNLRELFYYLFSFSRMRANNFAKRL